MVTNEEIINTIKRYCDENIYEKRNNPKGEYDEYKDTWIDEIKKHYNLTKRPSGNQITNITINKIRKHVLDTHGKGHITAEKQIPGASSNLRIDFYNIDTKTAIEVCLGPVKVEFEKDILKALLDREVRKLIIMFRAYKDSSHNFWNKNFFEKPSSKDIINLVSIFKLEVEGIKLTD